MTTTIDKADQVCALNDNLYRDFSASTAVITTGVAALGEKAVAQIVKTIAIYDDFCHARNPYQKQDFGAFDADGHQILFKIYYDKSLAFHSPDPADPTITERVITIMLANEY